MYFKKYWQKLFSEKKKNSKKTNAAVTIAKLIHKTYANNTTIYKFELYTIPLKLTTSKNSGTSVLDLPQFIIYEVIEHLCTYFSIILFSRG